jgi:predicted alpha/beta superfamily hydrolase
MESVAYQHEAPVDVRDAALLETAENEGRYLRTEGWTSSFLPTPRDLFVYLPEAYHREPERSFPTLILHDGQNLFDGNLSYVKGSTWRAGANADAEAAAGRSEPVILVGVGNAGPERMAEYTPVEDRRLGGGNAPLYGRLLTEELLPTLRAQYRMLPGPENLGIAGSSLGGLISLFLGMQYPEIFGCAGVISPSIWWANRWILNEVRTLREKLPLRIWMDMGTAEGLQHVRDANLLDRLLQARGWREGVDLSYRRYPNEAHNEAAWAARFGEVLRFLFPARQ